MALSLIRRGVPLSAGDFLAPSCVLFSASPDPVTTATFSVTATFSEDVIGFVVGDITVTNGAASGFIAASASIYTFTITPVSGGTVTVNVGAGVCTDLLGNPNTASNTLNRVWSHLETDLKTKVDAVSGSWYYTHQETSGAVLGAYNSALATGRDVALNTYADYTAGANWSNPSTEVARHAAGSVETLQQDGILAAGKTYQVTITVANRTAGSITITDGGAAIDANGETTRTITSTGANFIITPTTDFDGDIDVAILLVQQTGILASSAYADPANNPLSGAHTGVTVGQSASGALGLAVLDDGATSYSDIYSAEMNSVWNPAAGTLLLFPQTAAWTDSTQRRLVVIYANTNNYVMFEKAAANNTLLAIYRAAGTSEIITKATFSPTGYFMIAVTWEVPGNFSLYINGVLDGTPQAIAGTWIGNLSSTETVLGARNTTPSNVWDGYRTHAFYTPIVLDATTILRIAQLGGVA